MHLKQVGDGPGREQVIDRTGDPGHLRPQHQNRHLGQRRGKEGRDADPRAQPERVEHVRGLGDPRQQLCMREREACILRVGRAQDRQGGTLSMCRGGRAEEVVKVSRRHEVVIGHDLNRFDVLYRADRADGTGGFQGH